MTQYAKPLSPQLRPASPVPGFDAESLAAELQEISQLNLEIQRLHLPYKPYERHLDRCACSYRTHLGGHVYDSAIGKLPSAHMQITSIGLRGRRDKRIIALHDRLMTLPTVLPDASEITLVFGLTESGNPAITMKIDGMPVHPRPITARYLARRIAELAACLARSTERGPARHWQISGLRLPAASPEQAIWKWLCLNHRDTALYLAATSDPSAALSRKDIKSVLSGTFIYEIFDPTVSLAGVLGAALPPTGEDAA